MKCACGRPSKYLYRCIAVEGTAQGGGATTTHHIHKLHYHKTHHVPANAAVAQHQRMQCECGRHGE